MAKSWDYGKKNKRGSFSQKKKELSEYEELESSGFLQEISNNKRFKIKPEYLEEQCGNSHKKSKREEKLKMGGKCRFSTISTRHRKTDRISRIRETLSVLYHRGTMLLRPLMTVI